MARQGLRESKRAATERQLAGAAFDLVRQHGLAEVTIDDIVEEVGVSRRTFSNYFACKEAAIAAVIRHRAEDGMATWRPPTTRPRGAVALVRHLVLHQISSGTMGTMAVVGRLSREHPHLVPFVREAHWQSWHLAGARLRELADSEVEFEQVEIEAAMGAVFGTVSHVLAAREVSPGDDLPRLLDHVLTRLEAGFGTDA